MLLALGASVTGVTGRPDAVELPVGAGEYEKPDDTTAVVSSEGTPELVIVCEAAVPEVAELVTSVPEIAEVED